MSYLIAVATSDEVNIDLSFGAAEGFVIYEVEGTDFSKKEYRLAPAPEEQSSEAGVLTFKDAGDCGDAPGCGGGNGCGGGGGGCAGHGALIPKVELIGDCRSLVCQKVGFQAQKQLERKQIAAFAVDCPVEDALTKISSYFYKVDNHQSLRRISS